MNEIIPAVLPKNYEDLKNKIALVRGTVDLVQVDIVDGVFVKNLTWPFLSKKEEDGSSFLGNNLDKHFIKILNEQEGMPFWEDIDFELDLMVTDAVEDFNIYTKLGPKRMIFHIEAKEIQEDIEGFRDFLEGVEMYVRDSIQMGVAISPDMPIEKVFPFISCVDFVQVMGIVHEGVQGEKFDERCLEHIKTLKEKFPDVIISVDGGVDFESAPLLIDAGVDRLVVGSAIFNTDDIIGAVEEFKNL